MEQIKFSDFKIVPILESARRLKISDEVYFSDKYSDYISNSRLGYINPSQDGSPMKYKHPVHQSTQSLMLGSSIHELILQPEEFSLGPKCNKPTAKLGATLDKIIEYRKKGESIYDSIVKASQDCNYYVNQIDNKIHKIIKEGLSYYLAVKNYDSNTLLLSDRDWDVCSKCVENVSNNQEIQQALHPTDDFLDPLPSFNEDALFLDVMVKYKDKCCILKLKAKADNWTINEENKTLVLNDLKTTSHPINNFMSKTGSFTHYHYSRQFALYRWMLEQFCIREYGYNRKWTFKGNVLVVSTVTGESKLYKVNYSQLKQGKQEYEELLKRVAYYEMFGYKSEVQFR